MTLDYKKNSHCSYCGSKFAEQKNWPRRCFVCYNDSFSNPAPVVVLMLVVHSGSIPGLLIQKRNIDPKKGEWALTGGYIDAGETWQEAAVREAKEELGLTIQSEGLELYGVDSSTTRDSILICCVQRSPYDWFGGDDPGLKSFFRNYSAVPNDEVQAVDVMWNPQELAFPTHNYWANKFLKELQEKYVR